MSHPAGRVLRLGCPENQNLFPTVFAGLASVMDLFGPANPPVGVLAACVHSFAEHVLIVAGHGVLLAQLPRPLHFGRLCADGVHPHHHH